MLSYPLAHGWSAARRWGLLVVLVCASAAGQAQNKPAASLPNAEAFVSETRFHRMSISPANTHAAFIYLNEQGRRVLALIDLGKPEEMKVLVGAPNADVTDLMWVNARRIAFDMRLPGDLSEGQAGTFAIDIDGERRQHLIKWQEDLGQSGTRFRTQILPFGWFLYGSLEGRGDEVLVYQRDVQVSNTQIMTATGRMMAIARLDTSTGRLTRMSEGLPDGSETFLPGPDGELRAVVARSGGRERLFQRPPGSREWQMLEDHPLFDPAALVPLHMEADGSWIVRSRRGRDTAALFVYDPRSRRLDPEPLIAVDGFDVAGQVQFDARSQTVVGARVQTSRWQPVWFDERLAAAQKEVDQALPGRSNELLCGNCLTAERFVVHSRDDRSEGDYLLYDRPAKRLIRFAQLRPWLSTGSQGTRSFHRVPARDGLGLPVIVTHPPGAAEGQALPTVVLVHGGPWVRGGNLDWSAKAQFLASRGWRVLEVEFRGSTGFGDRHFRAGFRQWGQAMQDDLADALRWAQQNKLSEPGRACIVGASYGGYAALMGAVRHPDLYRCAVSLNGVTDLTRMFSGAWTDMSEQARRHDLRVLIGDPVADVEMLRRHSPLNRITDIKMPLMLVHGDKDERVDPEHTIRFVAAARAAGLDIQHVRYTDEGHGFSRTLSHADYLDRLEAFLVRHIGEKPR